MPRRGLIELFDNVKIVVFTQSDTGWTEESALENST